MELTAKAAVVKRKGKDARAAMKALIDSRSLSVREDEPQYPYSLAALAWSIADAMHIERGKRASTRRAK